MLTARAGVRRLRTCGGWRLARPIRAPASAPEPVEGLALYEITQASCATRVAPRTHRHPQTVMEWVHTYNERGAAALAYRRTGGRPLTWGGSVKLADSQVSGFRNRIW